MALTSDCCEVKYTCASARCFFFGNSKRKLFIISEILTRELLLQAQLCPYLLEQIQMMCCKWPIEHSWIFDPWKLHAQGLQVFRRKHIGHDKGFITHRRIRPYAVQARKKDVRTVHAHYDYAYLRHTARTVFLQRRRMLYLRLAQFSFPGVFLGPITGWFT